MHVAAECARHASSVDQVAVRCTESWGDSQEGSEGVWDVPGVSWVSRGLGVAATSIASCEDARRTRWIGVLARSCVRAGTQEHSC